MAVSDSIPVLTVSLRFEGMTWGALRGLVKMADQAGAGNGSEVLYESTFDDDSGILELTGIDLVVRADTFLPASD